MSTAEPLPLRACDEPGEVRTELRHLAEQDPARVRDELATGHGRLGDHLWERWGEELTGVGFDRRGFAEVLGGHRREVWHWLWGDRTWEQCVSGLIGRLSRRTGDVPTLRDPSSR